MDWLFKPVITRACSSVGRAFGSHPRGRGFESLQVHHIVGTSFTRLFRFSFENRNVARSAVPPPPRKQPCCLRGPAGHKLRFACFGFLLKIGTRLAPRFLLPASAARSAFDAVKIPTPALSIIISFTILTCQQKNCCICPRDVIKWKKEEIFVEGG